MFDTLAVITVFPVLGFILLLLFIVFVVWPKVKNSKWGEKKFDEMTSPGREQNTTADLIDNMKEAKDGLVQKSKDVAKTIKDATTEGKVIDKALGRDKDKE